MLKRKKKNKDMISIELGSYYVKFVLGKYNNGRLNVNKMLKVPLDKNVYANGTIVDDMAFRMAVDSGIKQLNTNVKDVILALESSEILKREIQIPKVEDADIRGLINFEVSQYLPIEISDYVIQYQILSSEVVDEKEKLNALVVAMPRSMVIYYFELLSDLKLNPLAMELSGNSIIKMLRHTSETTLLGNTTAIVDLGYTSADVIILENGINKLSRYVQVGFSETEEYITRNYALNLEQARELMTHYQDVGIKQLVAAKNAYQKLVDNGEHQHVSTDELNQSADEKMAIINEMLEQHDEILSELEKVFKYFTTKERGRQLDKIVLLGGHARIKDFSNTISENLGIETIVLDNTRLRNINFTCSIDDVEMYIAAIGGLIR